MSAGDGSDSDNEISISRKRRITMLDDSSDTNDDSEVDDNSDSESDGGDESEESGDEIDVIDDVSADQCSICLMEFTDQVLGIPESCAHVFCSVCLLEWSKNVNTCPVDRKVYHSIIIRRKKDGPNLDKIPVEDRSQLKEEFEDSTACEICGIGDREDRMLLCDGCDRGFHLECLEPPLDSVPHDEWFCSECSVHRRSQPEQPSLEGSEIYDNEILSVSQEATRAEELQTSSHATANERPSSSRRRARTVASSQRRRRRRRRTTGTRSSGTGQSARKKRRKSSSRQKKTTKTSTSSTSKTKTTTSTKRRRKTSKKRRKHKKSNKKGGSKEKNARDELSTARYVLPHEMEPTASFSIFGSDFDLEYLPVIEGRPVATYSETKPRGESCTITTSSTDVLGSIFTNLETLRNNNVTIDPSGRLIRNFEQTESVSESQNPTINSEPNLTSSNTRGELPQSKLSEVNRKRILYFEKAKREVKTFNTIFGDRKESQESAKKKVPRRRDTSSQHNFIHSARLNNFKIPRRSNTSSPERTTTAKSAKTSDKNGPLPARCVSSSSDGGILHLLPDISPGEKPLSFETNYTPLKETGAKEHTIVETSGAPDLSRQVHTECNETQKCKSDSKSKLYGTELNREATSRKISPAYTSTIYDGASCTPNTKKEPLSKLYGTVLNRENTSSKTSPENSSTIYDGVSCSSSAKKEPLSKLYGTELNRDSKNSSANSSTIYDGVPCTSTTKKEQLSKLYGTGLNRDTKNSSANSSTIYDGVLPALKKKSRNSKSNVARASLSDSKLMSTEENGRNIKPALFANDRMSNARYRTYNSEQGCMTVVTDKLFYNTDVIATTDSSFKLLPALCGAPSKQSTLQRPIAVVYPTTQGVANISEAATKRKEGIERLQRDQMIKDEVKKALKVFYRHNEIDKEQYKSIFKRAVKKIRETNAVIESRGVMNLVRGYVKKIKAELSSL